MCIFGECSENKSHEGKSFVLKYLKTYLRDIMPFLQLQQKLNPIFLSVSFPSINKK